MAQNCSLKSSIRIVLANPIIVCQYYLLYNVYLYKKKEYIPLLN